MAKDKRNLNNIVVIGGGTAGWLTALYAKKVLPLSEVTVVESEEIGILGAGEGSTPHLIGYLDFIGIPVSLLVKEAAATIKNGIKFTNWRNDGGHYYHSFLCFNGLGFDGCNIDEKYLSTDAAVVLAWSKDEKLDNIDFSAKVSEKNKVPFIKNKNLNEVPDPILNFSRVADFSVHFNASKLAILLKKIALDRGIHRVEGVVENFENDSYGDICNILLKNNKVAADFVFDCSGFSRLVIGNYYKSEWKSYSDILPVDSALPFFLPIDKESIPAYTEAIAMKYGWIWKIPTTDRFGCGYVYDSSLVSQEEIAEEIESYLGFEPEYPRKNKGSFKFNAGYYKTPYIKNCIAIGLSSGFIEPLEATSIWSSIESLKNALSNLDMLTSREEIVVEKYNSYFRNLNDSIAEFVYFHYTCDRNDTLFWKKFKNNKNCPEYVDYLQQLWKHNLPKIDDHYSKKYWTMQSWVVVGDGIGTFDDKTIAKEAFENNYSLKISDTLYSELKNKQDLIAYSCVDHKTFLEELSK